MDDKKFEQLKEMQNNCEQWRNSYQYNYYCGYFANENLQEFEELHIGDKFVTADNRILMKIRYADEFNCVDIESGIIETTYTGTYVVKTDVKVIVGD